MEATEYRGECDEREVTERLGETPVTEDALLLLHGAAEDDPDGEDEYGQGHPQGRVVVLQLASTVGTVSPEIERAQSLSETTQH